ncbi:hypothetical protein AKJ16_DCAP15927 [Drosera capensis]
MIRADPERNEVIEMGTISSADCNGLARRDTRQGKNKHNTSLLASASRLESQYQMVQQLPGNELAAGYAYNLGILIVDIYFVGLFSSVLQAAEDRVAGQSYK